ncbi:acetone carboxylase subunit gamma [Chloroflexota bacterium]
MQRINEYLKITGKNGEQVMQCRCGHILGPANHNYKEMSLMLESQVENIGPHIVSYDTLKEFVFRQFCCPNCQTLLATEIARKGEPILYDIQLRL